jgi:hypothetical protein
MAGSISSSVKMPFSIVFVGIVNLYAFENYFSECHALSPSQVY